MTVFCDYLCINQIHLSGVRPLNDGHIFSVDQDGVVKWDIAQKLVYRGSHDTSIRVRSDGFRVSIDGNIGRFDRSDNLFGYSVRECVVRANVLLSEFDLPPFTDSPGIPVNGKDGADSGFIQSGAIITRVDLTKNWETGSAGNCSQFIRHLQSFKSGRFEPRAYKTTGVSWGEGSKYWYSKVYDKAAEYIRQYGVDSSSHDSQLYDYILKSGIARHEISFKSRYLRQNNLSRLVNWGAGMEQKVYALFSDVVDSCGHADAFLEIPGRAGELAVAWRDGADLKKRLSHNTFYRYRRELLAFGIDIAVQSNVVRLRQPVEVITLSSASIPSWYSLPKVA